MSNMILRFSKVFTLTLFLASSAAYGAEEMTLYGVLTAYNSKVAHIQTENKVKVVVPRLKVLGGTEGLIVGKGMVTAKVTIQEFLANNPKIAQQYQKRKKPKKQAKQSL